MNQWLGTEKVSITSGIKRVEAVERRAVSRIKQPFINDTEENIRTILDACVRVKVKDIILFDMGMTLRNGDREYYYAALDKHFPEKYRQMNIFEEM